MAPVAGGLPRYRGGCSRRYKMAKEEHFTGPFHEAVGNGMKGRALFISLNTPRY